MARGETIAGLDIGTTKTCAVVAASGPDGLEILGIGEAPSTGMRKGVVTDLEETVRRLKRLPKSRAHGRCPHLARVRRNHRRAHPFHQQRGWSRSPAMNAKSWPATSSASSTPRRSSTSRPSGRSCTRCRVTSRSTDKTGSPIRSACRAAGSRSIRTLSPAARSFIANVLKCVHRAGLEPAGIVFEPLASSAATLLAEERARRLRVARYRRRYN